MTIAVQDYLETKNFISKVVDMKLLGIYILAEWNTNNFLIPLVDEDDTNIKVIQYRDKDIDIVHSAYEHIEGENLMSVRLVFDITSIEDIYRLLDITQTKENMKVVSMYLPDPYNFDSYNEGDEIVLVSDYEATNDFWLMDFAMHALQEGGML